MPSETPNTNPPKSSVYAARRRFALLVALAAIPFLVKAIALVAGAQGYGLQSIYKLFQLIVPVLWRNRIQQARGCRMLWPTDEPLPGIRSWMFAVAIAVALSTCGIAVAQWLLPQIGIDPTEIRAGLDARFQVERLGAFLVVVFLSLANSGLEELHFRAWLDRELSIRLGSAAGVALSAAAFGAMHVLIFLGMPGLPLSVVLLVPCALAVAGSAWSLVMRRPGGIHAAWLSHGLTDALLLGWGLWWLGYL